MLIWCSFPWGNNGNENYRYKYQDWGHSHFPLSFSITCTDATPFTLPQLPLHLTSYTLQWREGNMMSSARAMFTKWNCQTVCYTPSDSQFWINWIVYPSFVSYPNVSKNLDAGVKHKYLFIEIKRGRPAIAWRWRCEWCKYIYKYIYIYIYISIATYINIAIYKHISKLTVIFEAKHGFQIRYD